LIIKLSFCYRCRTPHVPADIADRVKKGERILVDVVYHTGVAGNVLKWGTGALNIDKCRIGTTEDQRRPSSGGENGLSGTSTFKIRERKIEEQVQHYGRWPANITHDGSDEVLKLFPAEVEGSSARFFYCAKASKEDRAGSKHPTVKPIALMQWLIRLVTPPNGVVLDPFAGSGSTGEAAFNKMVKPVLVEREEEYQKDIRRRMSKVSARPSFFRKNVNS
jgi:DNA modification methylase